MSIDIQIYARKGLEGELARLDAERRRVLSLLANLTNGSAPLTGDDEPAPAKRARQMSEAGRQAIREAVQRRWARVRAEAASEGADGGRTQAGPRAGAADNATSSGRGRGRTANRKKWGMVAGRRERRPAGHLPRGASRCAHRGSGNHKPASTPLARIIHLGW